MGTVKEDSGDKREYAKYLYLKRGLPQKEIAARTGVSENTISRWKIDDKWEDMKTVQIMTKEEELRRLYAQLRATNDLIESKGGVPNSKEADIINKITASIRQLQTDTGIAETIDVATTMIDFFKPLDLEKAKELTTLFDYFIQHKMKTT